MEKQEKKLIMKDYSVKLEKAIAREIFVAREIENDKAALKQVKNQKGTGEVLTDSAYESYDFWIENIEKQIKKGENALKNIAFKKVELEAVKNYIEN